jgi:MFS family permease
MSSTITASVDTSRRSQGTAAAALRNRNFRTMWLGMFASNIGTWMQTVVLPVYIDARTHSGFWVGMFTFAQLGPLLMLSIPGGVLADILPRKPWMIFLQAEQLVLSLVVAALVSRDAPLVALFLAQLAIGVGNAFNAPAMQSTVPNLVPKEDLPGAISLNSVMINGSRVIGPVIAAVLMSRGATAPQVFVLNAVTYLFVILAIAIVTIPHIGRATDDRGWANVMTGIRIARRRSVIGRLLVGMATFSFVSLPFVGLFPTIARLDFHMNPKTGSYKWLYATWGLGACLGALAIGTVLAHSDKRKLVLPFFLGFAVSLAAFAVVRSSGPAFPVGFVLGFFYFGLATSMLTIVQQNLRSSERARVMSLWFMAFGGTVAIGNLAFGPVIDAIGARPVLLFGAASAVLLGFWCDVSRRQVTTVEDDPSGAEPASGGDQRRDDALEARRATGLDESGASAGE